MFLLISNPSKALDFKGESSACKYGNGSNSRQCILCNCVFETTGETTAGKLAVANLVFTRKNSDKYPNSVCNVVYQPSQFTWTKSKTKVRQMSEILKNDQASQKAFNDCLHVTNAVTKYPPTKGPLWYHADYVNPSWASKLRKSGKIGKHIFYTDPKAPQLSFDNSKVNAYLAALLKSYVGADPLGITRTSPWTRKKAAQ